MPRIHAYKKIMLPFMILLSSIYIPDITNIYTVPLKKILYIHTRYISVKAETILIIYYTLHCGDSAPYSSCFIYY